ncbi:MAG: TonB-dependent receptor domain-containing protein [Terriglobia bacterium]
MRISARFLLATLFLALPLAAQQNGATVTGHIYDPSGAPVAGAKITARWMATGAVSNAESDPSGLYQLPFLNPGQYEFTVEKQGFRQMVQSGVTLSAAQKAVMDFPLVLGSVTQSVSVTANAPLLQAESGEQSWTIDTQRLAAIPIRNLNTIETTWFAPGVTLTGSVTKLRPFDTSGSQQEDINGGMSGQGGQKGQEGQATTSGNLVLVDGVSANTHAVGVGFNAISDTVQEVNLQTTMYDAQYGWSTGGVVNTITRGATNQWHGDAYEYFQDTPLNANYWQNNRIGIPRIPWHMNFYGGSVGAPIRKNKLFLFFAYQEIKQVQPDPFVSSVPTAAMRTGDFSKVLNSSGKLQTIYDPLTTQCSGSSCTRQAFSGNIIPSADINPVAKAVLALIPLGNAPGNPVTGLGNLVNNGSSRKFLDNFPEFSGRIDYNLSDKTHAFFRYSWNALSETRGYHYSTTSTLNIAETSTNSPFTRANDDFTFEVVHSFNPTTVLEFRTGMDRFLSTSGSDISNNFDVSSLSFSPAFVAEAGKYFPEFLWSGYNGAGSSPEGVTPADFTYSNELVLAKTYNQHNLKVGFQNMDVGENVEQPGFFAGQFSFNGSFTTANPLAPSSATGNSIADFLLGYPSSGLIQRVTAPAVMEHLWSVFGQDDIHVSRKLTVNLGLRWDYLGPLHDRFNALTRGFCSTCASPLQIPGMNLRGGLEFAGVGGNSRGIFNPHYNNFGPRIAFAYAVRPKTVVRGGYGIIYAQAMDNPGAAPGFSQTTNMVASVQEGIPFNRLTNPFPSGILTPVGSSGGFATGLGQAITFADPEMNIPRTQQYSLNIQHQFGVNWLASVAYVGSTISRLPVNQQLNYLPLSDLQLGSSALTKSVANPFLAASTVAADAPYLGLLSGTFLAAPTVQTQQLLVPYPQFPVNGVTEQFVPVGRSKFSSLQLDLEKRMGGGLDFDANFTWEKTTQAMAFLNPTDPRPAWTISPYDVPRQLKLSGVWDLPFGPGRRFGQGASPLVSRLLGGWFASGLFQWQQGVPMPFPLGVAPTSGTETIPNQSINRWFNTCTLLANGSTTNCQGGEQPAWVIRQPFQLMTWSPYLNRLREPEIGDLELGLGKDTRLTERYTLKFRADFINASNTTQWSFDGPDTTATDGTFGAFANFTNPSNDMRVIMLSLRFEF